jgi:hypothetical protein
MRLLESGATQSQIVAYLKNELDDHFGLDVNNYDLEAVAARVRAWFDRSWASSEVERP